MNLRLLSHAQWEIKPRPVCQGCKSPWWSVKKQGASTIDSWQHIHRVATIHCFQFVLSSSPSYGKFIPTNETPVWDGSPLCLAQRRVGHAFLSLVQKCHRWCKWKDWRGQDFVHRKTCICDMAPSGRHVEPDFDQQFLHSHLEICQALTKQLLLSPLCQEVHAVTRQKINAFDESLGILMKQLVKGSEYFFGGTSR